MKEALCKEFCNQLQIREVPDGLAVGTGLLGVGGDLIGFFIVGPDELGKFRVEDNGAVVTQIEADGADLGIDSRAKMFQELLMEYGAEYDAHRGEIKTLAMSEAEIPKAALRFVALLLRVQDLLMTTRERAENTFKEEVKRAVRDLIGAKASVAEDEAVDAKLADFPADIVIRAENRQPVAVFLVNSDARLYEAIVLQTLADYKAQVQCKVVAVLETDKSVSAKAFKQAMNRVSPLRYRGDEKQAIAAIAKDSLGIIPASLH